MMVWMAPYGIIVPGLTSPTAETSRLHLTDIVRASAPPAGRTIVPLSRTDLKAAACGGPLRGYGP